MANMKIPLKLWDPSVVMYLIIPDWVAKEVAELVRVRPTERFFEMVQREVFAHMVERKAPPAAIATAVMNIADDVMAGRDVVLRTGDYLALMNHAREQKIV